MIDDKGVTRHMTEAEMQEMVTYLHANTQPLQDAGDTLVKFYESKGWKFEPLPEGAELIPISQLPEEEMKHAGLGLTKIHMH